MEQNVVSSLSRHVHMVPYWQHILEGTITTVNYGGLYLPAYRIDQIKVLLICKKRID